MNWFRSQFQSVINREQAMNVIVQIRSITGLAVPLGNGKSRVVGSGWATATFHVDCPVPVAGVQSKGKSWRGRCGGCCVAVPTETEERHGSFGDDFGVVGIQHPLVTSFWVCMTSCQTNWPIKLGKKIYKISWIRFLTLILVHLQS